MTEPVRFRLLAITPPEGKVDPTIVQTWLECGVNKVGLAVLLRDPGRSSADVLAPDSRLFQLRRQCDRYGLPVLLSCDQDDLDAAIRGIGFAALHGIQLRADPDLEHMRWARDRLGDAILARSVHGKPVAGGEYVDYSCFGPVFKPRTNPTTKRAAGTAGLKKWTATEGETVFALGGIGPKNAADCLEAGAHGLAGISTFFGDPSKVADDVAKLCAAIGQASNADGSP